MSAHWTSEGTARMKEINRKNGRVVYERKKEEELKEEEEQCMRKKHR